MCDSKQPIARQFDDFRWLIHNLLMLSRLSVDWVGRVVDPAHNCGLAPEGYVLISGDERDLVQYLITQIEDYASQVDNHAALLDHELTGRKP